MPAVEKFVRICLSAFALAIIQYSFCDAYDRETPVVRAVRNAGPAVVNIATEYEVRDRSNPFMGFGTDPFFDSFFRDFFDYGRERKIKKTSLGSGVVVDGERGFILTNAHVISGAESVTVLMKDEREFQTKIVGMDTDSDLAILRVETDGRLPDIEMGNSDDMMIGETVIAIGNPFGFSHTVTTGVVSAINRSVRTDDAVYHDFIQIDASINPGNSGGPLLNINGELIGINTAIYAKAQGIGFAIPINTAKRIMSDLIRHGEVIPAWIGLSVQNVDARLAQYLGLAVQTGVIVREVEQKSPAAKAGVREGDVVLSVGNRNVHDGEDYRMIIRGVAAGDPVKLSLLREGGKKKVSLKAGVFPIEWAPDVAFDLLGIRVESVSRLRRRGIVAESGVAIVELDRRSHLAGIGARPGDVIRQMDEVTIGDVEDFKKAVVKYRKKSTVLILLQRGGRGYYLDVKMKRH